LRTYDRPDLRGARAARQATTAAADKRLSVIAALVVAGAVAGMIGMPWRSAPLFPARAGDRVKADVQPVAYSIHKSVQTTVHTRKQMTERRVMVR
jgi:hypothetical protein